MSAKRKVTLLLDEAVARELSSAVEQGEATSQSALVGEAVAEYVAARRREQLRKEYAAAARDPLFLEDMEAVLRDFGPADEELSLEP